MFPVPLADGVLKQGRETEALMVLMAKWKVV